MAVTFPRKSEVWEQHLKLNLISSDSMRSLPVHPVQLYESALAFLLAFMLWRTLSRPHRDGQVCCGMLLGYALIRYSVEFLRADNKPVYWGMTLSQVISLLMAAVAIALLLSRRAGREPKIAASGVELRPA
jgi:phosphatidylglycerol:prolipoprotein diacylglycerol transferase